MDSEGVDQEAPAWGSIALATTAEGGITHRAAWTGSRWGGGMLDFWDDFSEDGKLDERPDSGADVPVGSLAVERALPAGGTTQVTFLLAWHFPNRYNWSFENRGTTPENPKAPEGNLAPPWPEVPAEDAAEDAAEGGEAGADTEDASAS